MCDTLKGMIEDNNVTIMRSKSFISVRCNLRQYTFTQNVLVDEKCYIFYNLEYTKHKNITTDYKCNTKNHLLLNLVHFHCWLVCLYMNEVVVIIKVAIQFPAWLVTYVRHVYFFGDRYNISISFSNFHLLVNSLCLLFHM